MKKYKFDLISPLIAAIINAIGPFVSKLSNYLQTAKLGDKQPGIIEEFVESVDPENSFNFSLIVAILFNIIAILIMANQIPFVMLSIKRNGAAVSTCIVFFCAVLFTVRKFSKSNPL